MKRVAVPAATGGSFLHLLPRAHSNMPMRGDSPQDMKEPPLLFVDKYRRPPDAHDFATRGRPRGLPRKITKI
jgi:hypothetical protein